MKNLSVNQKNFLLEYFFRNEDYGGWKNIATTLIESGECIVAGKNTLWIGGIGNFIKTEDAVNAFECTLHKFDLDYFLTSAWYQSIKKEYIAQLEEKHQTLAKELIEINNL